MTVPVLQVVGLDAGYGPTAVLRDVHLEVAAGSVVTLLGSNGAGKTTLLRAAAGLLRPSSGTIWVCGEEVTSATPSVRAGQGLCLVPEGRGVWRNLTVRENLRLQLPKGAPLVLDPAIEAFPALKAKLDQRAGELSGGQQQMVALCRAFLNEPQVVLLDEVSMGLAPIVLDEIFAAMRAIADRGVSLLIVEQYVARALSIADQAYILSQGSISYSGAASDLDEHEIARHYLGDGLVKDAI